MSYIIMCITLMGQTGNALPTFELYYCWGRGWCGFRSSLLIWARYSWKIAWKNVKMIQSLDVQGDWVRWLWWQLYFHWSCVLYVRKNGHTGIQDQLTTFQSLSWGSNTRRERRQITDYIIHYYVVVPASRYDRVSAVRSHPVLAFAIGRDYHAMRA